MKIVLFGKLDNLSWGLESLISKNQDRAKVPLRLYDDSQIGLFLPDRELTHVVVLQGRRIDRQILRLFKCKKVLWNAEFLPYPGFENDPEALFRLRAIEPLDDFDLILNSCPTSTQWLKDRGFNAQWFPAMGVDPLVHRRMLGIDKDIDVGFYGTANDRRAGLFTSIAEPLLSQGKTVYWAKAYGEDLIRFINRCKIILNLHYTEQLNIESRVYEVLGCGSFCLSEPLSGWDVFLNGQHLSETKADKMVQEILWLLRNPGIREQIEGAGQGRCFGRYDILSVLNMLVEKCGGID